LTIRDGPLFQKNSIEDKGGVKKEKCKDVDENTEIAKISLLDKERTTSKEKILRVHKESLHCGIVETWRKLKEK
jgi:hypothetical protein